MPIMEKTCNLSTVRNTPSEARRNAPSVDYYYIDFCNDDEGCDKITSKSLSRVVNVLYDYLDESDISYIPIMFVCARMSNNSARRIFEIRIDAVERHMRISSVR